MRLMVKDFTVPTVMRFATLDLVRGDWRRYSKPLNTDNATYPNTTVDISTVSILENENRIPINYVVPSPGRGCWFGIDSACKNIFNFLYCSKSTSTFLYTPLESFGLRSQTLKDNACSFCRMIV